MLAKPAGEVFPTSKNMLYQPKWDGFRIIVFSSGDEVVLQPRRADDLAYAFPEVVAAVRDQIPSGTVLDGELVSAHDGQLWFEELGMRLRPRSEEGGWKIAELAEEYPASLVAFDLLAVRGRDLREQPDAQRQAALTELAQGWTAPVYRSPLTRDRDLAQRWFEQFEGAGLDGVIARPGDQEYLPGKRALLKVKHKRTADVVVAGWREHKNPGPDGEPVVGSLLLGLYDESGRLHQVGVASSFTAKRRRELVNEISSHAQAPSQAHPWTGESASDHELTRVPGAVSRWTGNKDLSWHPLRPELVAEVGYDHMQGDRFRHVASFKRWRPDRDASSCTYEQLDRPVRFDLDEVLRWQE